MALESLGRLFRGPGLSFGEPAAAQLIFGDAREIRLDVEYGGAVEHVNATHVKIGTVAAKQPHRTECNRIGTKRRSSREHAVRTTVGRRHGEKFEALRS